MVNLSNVEVIRMYIAQMEVCMAEVRGYQTQLHDSVRPDGESVKQDISQFVLKANELICDCYMFAGVNGLENKPEYVRLAANNFDLVYDIHHRILESAESELQLVASLSGAAIAH